MTAQDDEAGLPEPCEPLAPLSRREHAFWTLRQLAPHTGVSHLTFALRVRRRLRWWPLYVAVNHLLSRHPALRTRFPEVAGAPVRHVSGPGDVSLSPDVCATTEADLLARAHEAAKRPFLLATQLPFRVTMFQIEEGGSAVLVALHHIVSDGASLLTLSRELAEIYDGVAGGTGVPAPLQRAEPRRAEPPVSADDLRFWVDHLHGADPTGLELPWARPSPSHPTFAGGNVVRGIAPETALAMRTLRRTARSTENLILLSAFYLTLFRHGADRDLIVGVPVTTRSGSGDTAVGFGVSTMPLRVRLDPDADFTTLARQVRDAFLAGAQHTTVSAEALVTELGHRSPDWRTPLFRHLYNNRPWDESQVRLAGEVPESLDMLRDESRLDIQLHVVGNKTPPELTATYSTEIHDEADIRSFLDRMELLVREAAAAPDRPVGLLNMISAPERAVLDAVNDTGRAGAPARTVLDMFLATAVASPDTVAMIAGGQPCRYGELAATARRAAGHLRAAGVRAGDVVGLALGRGVPLAAGMLAVWLTGACYLPLDPGQPARRLAGQLADAAPRLVVTDLDAPQWTDGHDAIAWDELATSPDVEVAPAATPDSAAYVIYTSGSTGTPKGVVVTHRNLANVVVDFATRLDMSARTATLWSTTPVFDISALELLMPWTRGAPVIVADNAHPEPRALLDLIVEHDVAVVQGTPTLWRLVLAHAKGELAGRTVLCGGEPMTAELAEGLLGEGCRLYNVYGPTETTIWSTVAEISAAPRGPVPVGRPIANTTTFILDASGAEAPPGLPGELCVAGAGVSAGYHGLPELTAERFGDHPRHGRFYRTGDVARWRPDGSLELLGRNDRQVKVRGHRIELTELEAVSRRHPDVRDSAAVVADGNELRLFVQPAPDAEEPQLPARVWQHLREHLPSYAVPSAITVVDVFPRNSNGKLDYPALRSAPLARPATGSHPAGADPDPELTGRIVALWREILGRPGLGEQDNFFLNGGQSLLAMRVANRMTELLGRTVDIGDVFTHPTARHLSAHLSASG